MNLTKQQRIELNALSKKIWGTTSKWQKMLSNPAFLVPDGTEVKDLTKYAAIGKNGKTVVRRELAEVNGSVKPLTDEQNETYKKYQLTKYRQPDQSEMFYMMNIVLDEHMVNVLRFDKALDLLNISPTDRMIPFVYKTSTTLEFPWDKYILKSEDSEEYTNQLNTALESLPAEVSDIIKSKISSTEENGVFDTLEFVNECVAYQTDSAKTEEYYNNVMADLNKRFK